MKIATDAYGTLELEENGDVLETSIRIGDEEVSLEIMDEGASLEILAETVSKLSEVVEAYQAALLANFNDPTARVGVTMYLDHVRSEANPARLKAVFGEAPTTQQLFAGLVPYEVRIDLSDPESLFVVDVGVGNDLTDYLLCVTLNSEAQVQDIGVES